MNTPSSKSRYHDIPEVGIRRLATYYRRLSEMTAGVAQVSCADLARALQLDPSLVSKGIEMKGIVGKPRVGYPLGEAVLAGTGSLGSAVLGYERFRSHGMQIGAAFDIDSQKIGQMVHGTEVRPLTALSDFIRNARTQLGLIATSHLELRTRPQTGPGAGNFAERGPLPLTGVPLLQAGNPHGSAAV